MDRYRSFGSKNQASCDSDSQPGEAAREDGRKKDPVGDQLDIIAMVRSLQRTAGMADCFRRGNADCDLIDCDWRSYCIGAPHDKKKRIDKP